MAQEQHTPYIPPEQHIPEFTLLAVGLGILLAIILGAANAYLGLYAGMTVSASIPAAVISMGILRGLLRRGNILQNNMVQTIASAGESLAAGIIFTVPALVLVGAWKNFEFWPTTIIGLAGGLLGVVFMIPMRRALIVEDKELTFPEGLACAEVLVTGERGGAGAKAIGRGLLFGAVLKLASTGMGAIKGSLEWATAAGGRAWYFGTEVSAALIGVGYIVNLHIAALIFLGGSIGWLVAIPLAGIPDAMAGQSAMDVAWTLWSTKIRYLGVGTMLVGGIWSLISARHGIRRGFGNVRTGLQERGGGGRILRTERDAGLMSLGILFSVALILVLGLYKYLVGTWGMTLATTGAMAVASFFFVAVSSHIVGLVGSSNNPVSGMTICAVLGIAMFLLILGMTGDSAILATLGVAGVVCCAACIAGDCSQDLKTGHLVGATPRKQQFGEIIGVAAAAVIMAPTLTMLHSAYGIGTGLKAPQATLFSSIAKAVFGDAPLPYDMVCGGIVIGVVLIMTNALLKRSGSRFRTHVMPVAIGIYLPLTLSTPIFLGGLIRAAVEMTRKRRHLQVSEAQDHGVLLSSGFIAGEAVMGILLAVVITLGWKDAITITGLSPMTMTWMSLVALGIIVWYLRKGALERVDENGSPLARG